MASGFWLQEEKDGDALGASGRLAYPDAFIL
jgi:hypothetical protein